MDYKMIFMLSGGLGLFIYGMKMMGDALERVAGDRMKRLLEILTTNRYMGVLVGAAVTMIIQSSSASTVMVIGFVNAGLMNLAQATGVIMGANIGTTITAQLVAFKLTDIAPVVVFFGVGLIFFSKKRSLKKFGEILAGFGILFMGMGLMSQAMQPLRGNPVFADIMTEIGNPFVGILVGAVATVVLQSSTASIGIIQALAMQGLITMDVALYILFGQNIGTCVTALLASIGTNITARRAAFIHLFFNVVGTLFFFALIQVGVPYVEFIKRISGADVTRQIANAHTGFNVINTIVMFPLASTLVLMSKKLIPGEESHIEEKRLMFLDKRILETPPIAVAQIMKEVGRMGDLSRQNVECAMKAFFEEDEPLIAEVYRREEIINFLNREITHYLIMANGLELSGHDLQLVGGLFHVVNDIERMGDHAENLVEYAEYRLENGLSFSEKATEELHEMTAKVLSILDDSIRALKTSDRELAKSVHSQEDIVDVIEENLRNSHIARLNSLKCNPSSGVIFLDIISNLERIADHASNLAYFVRD